MARQPLRFVRASAAQVAEYTGPAGEPVFNPDAGALHVQDGQTPGGIPLATRAQLSQVAQDLLAKAPAQFEATPGVLRDLITAVKEIRTLRSFGVVGDGVVDDTVAMQRCFTYLRQGGVVRDTIGLRPRITSDILGHPDKAYAFFGAGRSRTVILIDFNGYDRAGLNLTHPTNPFQRGQPCILSGFSFDWAPGVTKAPCGLEYRSCSALFFYDAQFDQYSPYLGRGTSFRLTGVYNSVIRSISAWGGGCFRSAKLIPEGTRFSASTSAATVTATNPVFAADTVGLALQIFDGVYGEQFIVQSVAADGLSASVDHNPTFSFSASNTKGCFDGVKVTGSSVGSNVIQINGSGALTANDIGRVVYIDKAKANGQHLRTKITAVAAASGANQLVTLEHALGAAVSEQYLIISPVVEIYTDEDNATTNDIVIDDLAMEAGAGVLLLMADGYNIRTTQCKSHGLNPEYYAGEYGTVHHATLASAVFFNSSASFICEAEGQHHNKFGQIWVHNLTGAFHLREKTGYFVPGQRFLSSTAAHRTAMIDMGHVKNDAYNPPFLPLIRNVGCGINHYGAFKDTVGWARKLDFLLFQLGMNGAKSLPLHSRRGRLQITTTTDLNRACIVDFFFDGGGSGVHQVTSNPLIEVRNVALTGTTGPTGKITISVTPDGLLYIENQLSSYEECHVRVEMGMNG